VSLHVQLAQRTLARLRLHHQGAHGVGRTIDLRFWLPASGFRRVCNGFACFMTRLPRTAGPEAA
jgi:hypothetical protein